MTTLAELAAEMQAVTDEMALKRAEQDAYRATMPQWRRWLCRFRLHTRMPDPINSGTLERLGYVERFECFCGKAYWLRDWLGTVRM